ncbi:LemA family protein [Rubritalea sp.]|uniref:LemA family protein n=1 Tax=Rubritalea sp. TaxID=2109375 RepID=UPI003EF90296
MCAKKSPIKLVVILILVALLGVFGFSTFQTYNKIVESENAVATDLAQIDTQLQRRFDLIPNLVKTVKGYAKHEKETFENITKLRSQWGESQQADEKAKLANSINTELNKIILVAENYPDLKASDQFTSLIYSLEGTENRIAVSRTRYNESINSYNNLVTKLPGALFGKEKKEDYFQAAPEASAAPQIDL